MSIPNDDTIAEIARALGLVSQSYYFSEQIGK
jgi:hypothetical protein